MPKNLSTALCEQTPHITISDNRGLSIRTLAYNRIDTDKPADELISRNGYNTQGQQVFSIDPRLFITLQHDETVKPNFRHQYNLSGVALHTESVDSGESTQLSDIEGRLVMSLDAKGTRSWVTYESGRTSLGRPLTHQQQTKDGLITVTDRFFYAGNNKEHKSANLNGQCIRHYDTAGLQQVIAMSITGDLLKQERRLITNTLNPGNWLEEHHHHWATLVSDTPFVTCRTTNALGQSLTQTDAKNHTQRMAYNRAGQLIGCWLTLSDGTEQIVVRSITYAAAGQKMREESGNGVVTEYRYEPQTQRLIGIKTTRPVLKERPTLLQDLRYDYDPVGNILTIHNDAEATRFYRNQKVIPENAYSYDALYQLIQAKGRESDTNSAQCAQLPVLTSLTDSHQYINYTRSYTYDNAGNLLKIQHIGASQYTTHITVSDNSNHGIQQRNGLTSADIRSQFDAAGNQQLLQPGQSLQWDVNDQLQQVTMIERQDDTSDRENYLYDSEGIRAIKQSIHQTNTTTQRSNVTYLPGLELHTQHNDDKLTEDFQVITLSTSGRPIVRVLLWEKGKPRGIENGQLRYNFDNNIGSSSLELGGNGDIINQEEYYPFGGTALFASYNTIEAKYKTVRYSGKERDATGLYYYGHRYYMPWLGRWLSADPAGTVDGPNLYRMARNNPITFTDEDGMASKKRGQNVFLFATALFRRKGEGLTQSMDRAIKITRGVFIGLSLMTTMISICVFAGAAVGVTLGVAAIGFAIGALLGYKVGYFLKKIGGALAKLIQGKSTPIQMAACSGMAALTAQAQGATLRGTAVASITGMATGGIGAALDNAERGVGGAMGAGTAVGVVDTLAGNSANLTSQVSGAIGGAIGGMMTGTDKALRVGRHAGYGATAGSWVGWGADLAYNAPSRLLRAGVAVAAAPAIEHVAKEATSYFISGKKGEIAGSLAGYAMNKKAISLASGLISTAIEQPRFELAGAIIGAVIGGVGSAIVQTQGDSTWLGRAVGWAGEQLNTAGALALDAYRGTILWYSGIANAKDFGVSAATGLHKIIA